MVGKRQNIGGNLFLTKLHLYLAAFPRNAKVIQREKESLGTDFLRFAKQRWWILLARWVDKRMCVHFLCKELHNYNMLAACPITRCGSHEKIARPGAEKTQQRQ